VSPDHAEGPALLRDLAAEARPLVGGLGGCPFAPGAPGNVATEAIVARCEERGFRTGVDLSALRRARLALQSLGPP
jgi:hypothetical protein